MSDFVKLSGQALIDYFEEQKSRLVTFTKGHTWLKPKNMSWLTYCDDCGLVWLKNKLSQKAIKAGCIHRRLKERN